MLVAERLKKIKEILLQKKHVDVATLAESLNVSEVTIRRDLDRLESEGFLIKTYGGAILKEEASKILSPIVEEDSEKESIAKVCSYMIEDNQAIILTGGNICRLVPKHIKEKKNITVVTNDLILALECLKYSIQTIVTGGYVVGNTFMLAGPILVNPNLDIFADKAFIEVDGVSLERGFTVNNMDLANAYRYFKSIAKETIVVADSSKFDKISLFQTAKVDEIKKVISDTNVPDKYKSFFFENGIEIFCSFDLSDLEREV
ncbi:MAG: DeoR/GlpR family DNA-binding transcription regulator [Clostridia bacterium]